MKYLSILNLILIFIVAICLNVVDFHPDPIPSIVDKVLPSVVYVEVEGEDIYYATGFSGWSGSGFIVEDFIITAGHVVDGGTNFNITTIDGNDLKVTNYYHEPDIDVGILEVNGINLPTLELVNSGTLRLGEEVFIIGAPFGNIHFPSVTKGIVSCIGVNLPFFGDKLLLQVDAASYPGNSGSAVFNSKGKVIGILIGGYQGVDNISICVPSNVIKQVIKKYKENKVLQEIK